MTLELINTEAYVPVFLTERNFNLLRNKADFPDSFLAADTDLGVVQRNQIFNDLYILTPSYRGSVK